MLKLAAGGLACAGAAAMAYAVRGRSSTVFGPSVYRGSRERRAVALTFDDGPSESTRYLLDLLEEHHVPATFFQCGANVERLPTIARAVHRAGHQIGNHSYTHSAFYLRSPEFIEGELRQAQQAIFDATGYRPCLMRAPFGARWFGLRRAQHRLNLLGVMWTIIGYDWRLRADSIVARIARRAGNGDIICLHDGRELRHNPDIRETVEAVRRLIPMLRLRGYEFETVSQLLCLTN
jgi:peptidoglycan/xylan/chitin deacetylase (PgdA/CDA1 family)